MFSILKNLNEIFIIVISIYLIYAGLSKKEIYNANNFLKKRILIIGITILILSFIFGIPEMYKGFIEGWKAASK